MSDGGGKKTETALGVKSGVSLDTLQVRAPKIKRRNLTVEEYVDGVRRADRAIIGRTFSLMESANAEHRAKAGEVLEKLLPFSGKAIRVGISGVPGAGKSTFIEALGTKLIAEGKRVAVLAVDPSSDVSGGSILGDKTRMENLTREANAFVRPTACGTWLGGVARGTRESIIVCEAAGFDVVFIETVGVGQSETQVASMVDFFLLILIPGGGDELQGIKRGIIELADAIAINKADGENIRQAELARAEYQSALRLLRLTAEGWNPRVVTCSAYTGKGVKEIWEMILEHNKQLRESGQLETKRRGQALYWLKQSVEHMLIDSFYRDERVNRELEATRNEVLEGRMSPFTAAEKLVGVFQPSVNSDRRKQ